MIATEHVTFMYKAFLRGQREYHVIDGVLKWAYKGTWLTSSLNGVINKYLVANG
jgi:hypothetical protein